MNGHNEHDNFNEARRSPPVVTVDYEAYAPYLEGTGYSEDQKRELLEALWSLVCEFVAMGYEVHPLQQAREACGELSKTRSEPPISSADRVQLKGQFLSDDFNDAAAGNALSARERIPT